MKEIFRVQNETMGIICQNQVIINYLQKSCRGLGKKKKGPELVGRHHVVSVATRTNQQKR